MNKRPVRKWSLRVLLSLIVLIAVYCGNTFVNASCQRDCDQQHDICLLTGALYSSTPDGARSDFFSLLYLSCQSAYYVCEDTCGSATGRL